MDEQRIPKYLYLIQELLRCSPGREEAVLSDNPDLLDAGLVEIMKQMAAAEKNFDIANRLNALANQVDEKLNSPSRDNPEDSVDKSQLNFISKVLQAIADSKGNPQVVYPLFQQNLDKLNRNLAQALKTWADRNFQILEPKEAEEAAGDIMDFSCLIQQFPLGNRASNLEIAIIGHQQVLRIYTRETFLQYWIRTHVNLADAYIKRIEGDKADNIEKAIAACQKALQICTREAFPQDWANAYNNLGLAYFERIEGSKKDNIERAINAYQKCFQVYTPQTFPQQWARTYGNLATTYIIRIEGNKKDNLEEAIDALKKVLRVFNSPSPVWAMSQTNLASAYYHRIEGDKGDNLEKAIAAFKKALQFYTYEKFPQKWAMLQNNLGLVYTDRIKLNKADNLEKAIEYFQQALRTYTREEFPLEWAKTHQNLGIAYSNRIKGELADNIEQSIAAFKLSLQVRIREALPENWARTQLNLGGAYSDRIKGDQAENIEEAIVAIKQALQIFTHEAFPQDWALAQNNLGVAYLYRIKGEPAQNLEEAITSFGKALQVHTREAFHQDWARTQHNLGDVYSKRKTGDKADNIEKAIAACQQALQVYTRKAFPWNWARTQQNIGIAYQYRIKGDRAKNFELAISALQGALQVFAYEAFPQDWAAVQNSLGIAYQCRIKGNRSQNLELAISAFQKALTVWTPEAIPMNCLKGASNLGDLAFTQNNWQLAIDNYEKAMQSVELSRSWATTDDRRQEILAEAIEVYQKQVQAYINIEQWDKAIETVERSKTRNLVELLANRDFYPKGDVPKEIISQLDRLRRSIPSLERQLQVVIEQLSKTTSEQAQRRSLEDSQKQLQQELQSSRQQLDEVLDRIKPIDSSFSLTQRVEQIAFSDIQSLMDDRTAAIEWYVTEDKILTFILTANSLLVEQASAEKLEALGNWGNDYWAAYPEKGKEQWKANLASNLEKLAEILNIDRLLTQIDEIFDQQGEKCARLILIPHRFLHLFSLHALPLANGDLLLERFSQGLSYAPSIQLLQLSKTWSRPSLKHFFSVKNPTEDLSFADIEVNAIRRYFHPHDDVLEKQFASKTALTQERLAQTNVAHFSCHGYFNFETPSQSALLLAGSKTTTTITSADQTRFWESRDGGSINLEKCLTLGDIFALDLRQCRLATLSACETGLTDFKSKGDEYVGLPSGFLYAGSPSVVSSLWTVDDLSTAFLTIQFYQNLQDTEQYPSVAIALNQAQLWLRDITKAELKAWMTASLSIDPAIRQNLDKRLLHKLQDDQKPFQDPFHWAAFCAIGQ